MCSLTAGWRWRDIYIYIQYDVFDLSYLGSILPCLYRSSLLSFRPTIRLEESSTWHVCFRNRTPYPSPFLSASSPDLHPCPCPCLLLLFGRSTPILFLDFSSRIILLVVLVAEGHH
ncbi:hypothetical protein PVAG01_02058 [Phlyctema vagabunda]|uniref:Uncharacterized protein n=1 Tax=Phlyctema vagabunda TaxID=108571 RepID=A0ABR4PPJ1_9HELO